MKTERERRLELALLDMLTGWEYIRRVHGDLYGVGWDRAQEKAVEALSDEDAGGGGICPVCEKGELVPQEYCYCLSCGADPVLTDQIKRNESRLREHGWPEKRPSKASPRQRDALEALRIVDRHMSGNDSYEGIWVNYPDKPEQSPASVVREALTYEDAGGGEWCPSCGGQGCEDCRDTTRSVPEAVRRLPDRMRQIADMKHPLIYDIVVEWAEELDRALAQSGEGRVPEGYRPLTRDEALLELWQAINHPWGKTTDDKVILQRLHESGVVLAAPEPGPEKDDE